MILKRIFLNEWINERTKPHEQVISTTLKEKKMNENNLDRQSKIKHFFLKIQITIINF